MIGWLMALTGVIVLFFLAIRPWYTRWGATRDERLAPLPGDGLVPCPKMVTTRAITIAAPAAAIWPWLVQVGYGRAGWYNLDWVNAAMGVADYVDGHRSADRIIPELQAVKVGDVIKLMPAGGWMIMQLATEQHLVFLSRIDFKTGQPFDLEGSRPAAYLNSSQVLVLRQIDDHTTRFIVRDRLDFDMGAWTFINWLLEPGFFIQESSFMRGVKRRAEAGAAGAMRLLPDQPRAAGTGWGGAEPPTGDS